MDREIRYCVLYTGVLKQPDVARVLIRTLPDDAGDVFYPCTEFWHNEREGKKKKVIRPMFPGYVFIRSRCSNADLHQLVRDRRREIDGYVRELFFKELTASGTSFFDIEENESSMLKVLSVEEAEFFEFMFFLQRKDGEQSGKPSGILAVSSGYVGGAGGDDGGHADVAVGQL